MPGALVPWGQPSTAGPWAQRGWQHHEWSWWLQVFSSGVEAQSCAVSGLRCEKSQDALRRKRLRVKHYRAPLPQADTSQWALFPSPVLTQGTCGMFSLYPSFSSGLKTYFRAPLSSFQARISTCIARAGTKICLQLQFKACILEVMLFNLDLWVSMFWSREACQTHILYPGRVL